MNKHDLINQNPKTVPKGKIICYITGKERKDTPEERVRQAIARSLVEEYNYEKKDIAIEFSIKMGRKTKRADIVIFYENKKHSQENIYIIVEAKKEKISPSDKKEGIEQLKSYLSACLKAQFGLWVGSEKIAVNVFRKQHGIAKFLKIPDIPRKGEKTIPKPKIDELKPTLNLRHIFKRIHNYIYGNQGFQKYKAFEEMLKIIFIKIYDEQFNSRNLQFFVLPNEEIRFVRERLTTIFEDVKKKYRYIFKQNDKIELNDRVLFYIVSELQRVSLLKTKTDVKGQAYEEIVGPNLRGDRGEFFTPRNVCDMTVKMVLSLFEDEYLLKPTRLRILDPAVGTGGFLISAIHHFKEILRTQNINENDVREKIRDIAQNNLFGIDFNPFLVKVAQMNMVMHGDGSSNIVHADSLSHPKKWEDIVLEKLLLDYYKFQDENYTLADLKKDLQNVKTAEEISEIIGIFDIVITNPPFGSNTKIDDIEILSQYEITIFDTKSPRKSLPPEQLFVERCLQFLKPGGILGIVLPDSILSNPGLLWLRKWLLEKTEVIASIDLPSETFEPSTGTQTSVLVLRKKEDVRIASEDYEVFMAIPEKVGHDKRGNPIYKMNEEGEILTNEDNEPIIDDHLPFVSELFIQWLKEKGVK